jgi:hypothetical protein
MEMSQLNFLYSCVKQTKTSLLKNGEQEGNPGPVWGLALVGGGRM